ncbi:MAG: hypothetical protein JWM07_132 [Candidatus Saccharibacteria bacterium]|nr:hypothetical protein [Candidatus Saccharibacteria bacterium]
MPSEENAPSNVQAFRLAVRKHNAPTRRKQRIRTIAKILCISMLVAIVIASVIYVTHLLLANHASDSSSPPVLLVAMAIIGAVLVVGTIVAVVAIIVGVIFALIDVGINSYFMSLGAVKIVVPAVIGTIVTTLYLAAFFNA